MEKSYSEKLKDPRWQKKRLEILERDSWMCCRCQEDTETLHVHHVRYFAGKDPWEYENRLLVTLCESCHQHERDSRNDYERDLLEILKDHGFLADDIHSIASGLIGLSSQYPPEVTASIIEKTFRNHDLWEAACEHFFATLKSGNNV